MDYIIRKGKREDIQKVFGLVKELAEFENGADEVVNTAEKMEEDCFGPDPIFDFFVAETTGPDKQIYGMAVYYTAYSTWKGRCIFLEDIVVTEKARGNGMGKSLFLAVVKVANERGVDRMMWQVLDWNQPAINFYGKMGAKIVKEWLSVRLVKEELEKFNL